MTTIPGRLLDLARAADATPARVAPLAAQRVARLILAHLPDEPRRVIWQRQAQLIEAVRR